MLFLVELAISIGITVAAMLLTPRPKRVASGLAPNSLSQLNLPTIEQGAVVPYIAGTVLLDAPTILWDGDFTVSELQDDQSNVIGYQYHIGMHLGLCLGEIDDLLEIRFDRKALPGGPIAVSPGRDMLAIQDVTPHAGLHYASIPQAFYADPVALCQATTTQLNLACGRPASYFRVVWGHQIVANWNDQLLYAVKSGGTWREMDIRIPAGDYKIVTTFTPPGPPVTTSELFTAVAAAINAAESTHPTGVTVTCIQSAWTQYLELGIVHHGSGDKGFKLYGTGSTQLINTNLGIHHNLVVELEASSFPATLYGTFLTLPERYLFGGGETNSSFAMSSAASTARRLFGANGNKDYLGTGACAEYPVSFTGGSVSYVRTGEHIRATISAPNQFGIGDGVAGEIDVYVGSDAQTADTYLGAPGCIGSPLPAYRGLCYAVLRNFWIGNAGQFRPIAFVVCRYPDPLGLGAEMSNLCGDANPANLLYDLLTNPLVNQKPLPADQIELADFLAAGETLYEEGLGLSLTYDLAGSLGEQLDLVLKHIDGLRYLDPETGRLRLKLIRDDYDVEQLVHLDQGNLLSCKYGRRCWADTKNTVRLTYRDRLSNFAQRVVQVQDLANIQLQDGNVAIESAEFEGFSNEARARWAAERCLKTVGYPGAPFELTANLAANGLRPGDAFILDWAPLGISGMICRVATMGFGTLRGNRIQLTAIEDIWGTAITTYIAPSQARWVNPAVPPEALLAQRLLEAPYTLAGGEIRRILALGARGLGEMQGFSCNSDPAGGESYAESNPAARFTPSGLLAGVMGYNAAWFSLAQGSDLGQLKSIPTAGRDAGWNLCLIDDEWLAWQDVVDEGDGTINISGCLRGVLDTTPARHLAGARVWFPSVATPLLDLLEPESEVTVSAKLLPRNLAGALPEAAADPLTLTTVSRAWRPYLPTDVRLGGESYPDGLSSGSLTVTWEHRDRLSDWSYADRGATATPEAGCSYTVELYDPLDELVETHPGITTNSCALSATPASWTGYRVVITVVGSELDGYQLYDYRIGTSHGWGLDWGTNWGGAVAA